MKELYNDMDDRSRDTARNIRIAFDDNAWDKMEALLNEEDRKPVAPIISNTFTLSKEGNKTRKWLQLFLVFLLTGAAILSIKNKNTLQNKTLPLANNNNKALNTKARKTNQENVTESQVKAEQRINEYLWQQQSKKNNTGNKNFKPKATIDKKITLTVTTNSSYKKEEKISNKKIETIAKKHDLFKAYNDVQENGKNNLPLSKQSESNGKIVSKNLQSESGEIDNDDVKKTENQLSVKNEKNKKSTEAEKDSNQQEVKKPLIIDKKDSVYTATVNKNKKPSAALKNKFLENIGFSVFASPEVNTVKFKGSDKVTVSYGAGINYTIGKHFTLQAQFAKTRKVYVTDRKGYNPPAGSSLIPIDTLKVNADCKVWDIPVNLRYSFTGNIKNSFFISAGISSYIMKKEIYNFAYYDQGVYETKQRIIENENKHSFCNLNLSVGYQYWLNKKWSIGFEPYFKLPLNGIGAGKVKLTSTGALFSLTFKPL
jgi:hypothetical protein